MFVSPDRIQHCLLEYVHPGHPDFPRASQTPTADRVRGVYRLLDEELGTLVSRTGPDDVVMLMSDHGHQPVTRALNMNRVLQELGYLRLARGSGLVSLLAWGRLRSIARVVYDKLHLHGKVAVPTPAPDWAHTRAYTSVVSTGEGVSIALQGREPEGIVPPEQYEHVRDGLAEALLAFTDPDTGAHPIKSVRRARRCSSGAYLDRAPDLLLEAAPLYSLTHARATGRAGRLALGRPPSRRACTSPPRRASTERPGRGDLAAGLRRHDPDARRRRRARPPPRAARAAEHVYSDDEQAEVEQRLRELGYLE